MLIALIIAVISIGLLSYFILKGTKKNLPVVAPADYAVLLNTHIPFYSKLSNVLQQRFVAKADAFLQRVQIEGIGFQVEDSDRIMVAASAVIPILNFDDWSYPNLTNVILYPDTFNNDFQYEGENRNMVGLVGNGFMNGQMLLSRSALIKGFSNNAGKENVGIHEFMHLIDGTDGATDGTPENLMTHEATVLWLKMMHQEMHRIEAGHSDINPYALTSEAEFLAVASEYFFEKPDQLSSKHPQLYEALSKVFNQHPAANDTASSATDRIDEEVKPE
ncbi:M90 family metallopeptidase [Mucilaginibacter sp.]